MTNVPKPVVLIVLDGWGIADDYPGNAITMARTPNINDYITKYPATTLVASGESVGLPWGEMGNSEVGHLNLGMGRIIYQQLPRINKSISDNSFYKNKVFLDALEHTKKHSSKMHLIGLVSNGGVHSSIDHLHALLVFAKEKNIKDIYIHAILDGRDTPFNSGLNFIRGIERTISEYGIGHIATISGRFYAMDRNNNWDRTAKAFNAMTEGVGNSAETSEKAIEQSYKKKIYDEEFVPTVIKKDGTPLAVIEDNDAVIFFNFRPDRARQLTKSFVIKNFEKFNRKKYLNNLYFATFTEYEEGLPVNIVFEHEKKINGLGEVLSRAGVKQLRISETEKYAHVTYFFNGGEEKVFEGEEHILVPSPAIDRYDQKPDMSAREISKKVLEEIEKNTFDFILINFANADMIGHTSNIKAAIEAVETVDELVGKIAELTLAKNGVVMITADHGNAEAMFNMQTGMKDKEHTLNPVPFILISNEYEGKNFGWQNLPGNDLSIMQPQGILSDVAPTVLKIFNIEKPDEMTGRSLI